MKLSIGIPIYNSRNTLFECLSSIALQILKPFEVIIVDDASTEDYFDIIEIFKNILNIKYYRNNINSGVGATRQIILNKLSGDYITFIDADDIFTDVYFFDHVSRSIKMFSSDYYWYDFLEQQESGASVLNNSESFCFGKVYKVDYLNKNNIKFSDTLRTHEDICFNLKVGFNAKTIRFDFPVYLWKYNKKSITRSSDYVFENYKDYVNAITIPYEANSKIDKIKASEQTISSLLVAFYYYELFKYFNKDKEILELNKNTLNNNLLKFYDNILECYNSNNIMMMSWSAFENYSIEKFKSVNPKEVPILKGSFIKHIKNLK